MDALGWTTLAISLLALVAAGWSAFESWRLGRVERQRDQRQEDRERQEQARQVAAWMCVVAEREHNLAATVRRRWFLAIENSSQVPVYDGHATITSKYPVPALEAAMFPPGRTYFELGKNEWGYGVQSDELAIVPRPLTNAERFRVTSLAFTDAAGTRWTRDEQGRLAEGPAAADTGATSTGT